MFKGTVTFAEDGTETVSFGRPYTRVNVVQKTGDNAGTITFSPIMPGEPTDEPVELDSSSNSMDLTSANVVHKIGANGDQIFGGLSMVLADSTSAVTLQVYAWDSVGI